ncbi:PIR Superfamily Protein [Plasmodium ovale curtisi]|uniref:PIR Superfamily Protein n=1 Tax=Plasmodium ovale curtisi TaxID=864141 RepID=A0A1A8WQT1_PLAOA|nr:PIR Superfamily Protein [Plasmodium ovale curtisi]
MELEILTIYNAAYSNYIYKNRLDSYKNEKEKKNLNGCGKFTSEHLNAEDDHNKICEAVILFLSHLNEEHNFIYNNITYEDITYKDNGCKYLFYWLYTHVKSNEKPFKNTLILYNQLYKIYNEQHKGSNIFNKYINVMNEHTIEKLVKLTEMYNKLEHFYEGKSQETGEKCISGVKDLYTEYLDECIKGRDHDFCDELKNFRKKHNYYVQKFLHCVGEQYLLPPVEVSDIVDTTIIPFSLVSVSSLILPILYKFTAFGPWVRHLIGKNRNAWDNINKESDQLLNTYEIEDDVSNMRNFNIPYNSS